MESSNFKEVISVQKYLQSKPLGPGENETWLLNNLPPPVKILFCHSSEAQPSSPKLNVLKMFYSLNLFECDQVIKDLKEKGLPYEIEFMRVIINYEKEVKPPCINENLNYKEFLEKLLGDEPITKTLEYKTSFSELKTNLFLDNHFNNRLKMPVYSCGGGFAGGSMVLFGEEFSVTENRISLLGVKIKNGDDDPASFEKFRERELSVCSCCNYKIFFFKSFSQDEREEMEKYDFFDTSPMFVFGKDNACLIIAYRSRNNLPYEFLVLDPRYQGEDKPEMIIETGHCAWKTFDYFKQNGMHFILRS